MKFRIVSRTIAFFSLCFTAGTAGSVEVPIEVVPLVPFGVTASWAPGVVTVGVPLSADDHIRDVSQLGFRGTDAAQFRVLQRDAETQEIRWVQVHFLASQPDDRFALTNGRGNFGGASLIRDLGDSYRVDTGAAVFTIEKSRFRFLDDVQLQGRSVAGARQSHELQESAKASANASSNNGELNSEVIPAPSQGGVVVISQGQRFESALDSESVTTVEENGPVRSVLVNRGVLRNAAGERHLAYTVRMVFDRYATQCRVFVTLRNAERSSLTAKPFDAAWLELPLASDPLRRVRYAVGGSDYSGMVPSQDTAFLYQADNDHMRTGRTSRIVNDLCQDDGLQVNIAGTEYNSLGNTTQRADGVMGTVGASGVVLAGMRDMATQFPSGFHLQADLLSVDLFSRHNATKDLLFAWGAHETREILFEFAPGADPAQVDAGPDSNDRRRFAAQLQAPWIGRCSFEHYRDSGAVFGEKRLVSIEEERAFFAADGHTWSHRDLRPKDLEYDRQYSFRTTGGGNQFDQDLTRLIDFMRANHTGRFLQARLGVLWKADQAVYHSDDFDYGVLQNGVSGIGAPDPDTFHGKGAGSIFDDEHPHWVSMILYYRLTGDERVREAIEDYGEYRRYRAGHPFFGAINGGGISHFRLWSRAFRDVALLYEFTGQARYLEDLRTMARTLTGTMESDGSRGRNMQRGYFYFGKPEDVRRRIHLFFLTEMNPIGVREAMRVLPAGDPLREELRDYLTGLAWFTLREAQVSPTARGYPYGYYSAEKNDVVGKRGDQTGILLTHGYEQTGNVEFIERARKLTWRVIVAQHDLRAAELSTHIRIHRWLHRDAIKVQMIYPSVQRNLDGSYTLDWPVPMGAQDYVIKYGRKRLVPNLEYQQQSRSYLIDPTKSMNFWAAQNLANEPRPSAGGERQTWRTPVLPEGSWSFAIQVKVRPRSSNPLDIEELEASAAETSVSLSWKMDRSTRRSLESVEIERAPRAAGPWKAVSSSPSQPEDDMSFEDQQVVSDEVYFYRLRLRALDGSISFTKPVLVRTSRGRWGTNLLQPRDPPGGGPVEIRYSIGDPSSPVLLTIYDVRGHRVSNLQQGIRQPGLHMVQWNRRDSAGSRVARGLYFVRLQAGNRHQARKLILH